MLEIFVPSDLQYQSWGREILMAILDVFYLPLKVLVLMILSFGHHLRQSNILLFKRSTALWCRK